MGQYPKAPKSTGFNFLKRQVWTTFWTYYFLKKEVNQRAPQWSPKFKVEYEAERQTQMDSIPRSWKTNTAEQENHWLFV